jgi:multidrug efflux system membrane fusion protein
MRTKISRKRFYLCLLCVILSGAVFGLVGQPFSGARTQSDAEHQPHLVPVRSAVSARGNVDVFLSALGTVTPEAAVVAKSEISGKLVQIKYEEGQMVKAGDVLARVESRPYQYALDLAKAQLVRDQALLKNAQLNLARYDRLVKLDSLSQQQRDTQVATVQQYESAVDIDLAQVQTAQLNLDYCEITAPISGRVGLRPVDPGNYVTAGDTAGVAQITQLQPISVIFALAEDYLPDILKKMQAHHKISVEVYDRANKKFLAKGFVKAADNLVDVSTGTVKFKAQFDNDDFVLFPNQFVNVKLLIDTIHDAVVIPDMAIQYGPAGPFVYTLDENDTATMRTVTLGAAEGDKVSVTEGLLAGQRIVTTGANMLRDRTKVRIEGLPSPAAAVANRALNRYIEQ